MGKKDKRNFLWSRKDINLNSPEWCEIIFEGRKNNLNAYEMRRGSSKRHILAFIIVIGTIALLTLTPLIIKTIESNYFRDEMVDVAILSNIKFEGDKDDYNLDASSTPPPLVPSTDLSKKPKLMPRSDEIEIVDSKSIAVNSIVQPDKIDISDTTTQKEIADITDEFSETYKVEDTYTKVDEMPSYRGGEDGLRTYIASNLVYPYRAYSKQIQGSIICTFIIEKDGSVSNIKVTQKGDSLLNAEAIRALSLMPKWKPGRKGGRPVRVKYTLPIIFSLY